MPRWKSVEDAFLKVVEGKMGSKLPCKALKQLKGGFSHKVAAVRNYLKMNHKEVYEQVPAYEDANGQPITKAPGLTRGSHEQSHEWRAFYVNEIVPKMQETERNHIQAALVHEVSLEGLQKQAQALGITVDEVAEAQLKCLLNNYGAGPLELTNFFLKFITDEMLPRVLASPSNEMVDKAAELVSKLSSQLASLGGTKGDAATASSSGSLVDGQPIKMELSVQDSTDNDSAQSDANVAAGDEENSDKEEGSPLKKLKWEICKEEADISLEGEQLDISIDDELPEEVENWIDRTYLVEDNDKILGEAEEDVKYRSLGASMQKDELILYLAVAHMRAWFPPPEAPASCPF